MDYFKAHWNELRRDDFADWGTSWWHFEVADDGTALRQIEIYSDGTCLTYDRRHVEDRFGGLAVEIDRDTLKTLQRSSVDEFAAVWRSVQPINRDRP